LSSELLAPDSGRPQSHRSASTPVPVYDLNNEESLPSPFLKKTDRDRLAAISSTSGAASVSAGSAPSTGVMRVKRPSSNNLLRAVAAANSAAHVNAGRTAASIVGEARALSSRSGTLTRPSILTRRTGLEARKILTRT